MYKINLDDYIYVSLTHEGEQILIDNYNKFAIKEWKKTPEEILNINRTSYKTDNGKFYYKFQIHELMHIFGEDLIVGSRILNRNAYLVEEPIKEELKE